MHTVQLYKVRRIVDQKMTIQRLLVVLLAVCSIFLPLDAESDYSDSSSLAPPLVREGEFAIQLVEVLGIGPATSEYEAGEILVEVGILPEEAWAPDDYITPEFIGALGDSIGEAADTGRIWMSRDEAMEALYSLLVEFGLPIPDEFSNRYVIGDPPYSDQYCDHRTVIRHYSRYSPPKITYCRPPYDYYDRYVWVPYGLWWYGHYYSGYYIFYHLHLAIHRHHHFHHNHEHHKHHKQHKHRHKKAAHRRHKQRYSEREEEHFKREHYVNEGTVPKKSRDHEQRYRKSDRLAFEKRDRVYRKRKDDGRRLRHFREEITNQNLESEIENIVVTPSKESVSSTRPRSSSSGIKNRSTRRDWIATSKGMKSPTAISHPKHQSNTHSKRTGTRKPKLANREKSRQTVTKIKRTLRSNLLMQKKNQKPVIRSSTLKKRTIGAQPSNRKNSNVQQHNSSQAFTHKLGNRGSLRRQHASRYARR